MGTFSYPITLISASGRETAQIEALVDAGATFTTVPAPLLHRLGVDPRRTIRLRLANGRREERPIGTVKAELDGVQETTICVFGDPDGPALIGSHTLEAFLLGVDSMERRLVPVDALWALRSRP